MKVFLYVSLYVFPVMVQVHDCSTPIQVWTISEFVLFAGILNKIWDCSNFIVGDAWVRCSLWCEIPPTEQLSVIKLFDNPCGLKKSVMWTCGIVDALSNCGKVSVLSIGLSITDIAMDLGFWEVDAGTKRSHRFCGLWYAFMTCFWCRNRVL